MPTTLKQRVSRTMVLLLTFEEAHSYFVQMEPILSVVKVSFFGQ